MGMRRLRFDDSLKTVLAADTTTAFGARAAFRQLVDLVARGRVPADAMLLGRIADLRASVPPETRATVARGLALAEPPAALVALFARDTPDVAAAVLRAARLTPADWDDLIPALGPHGRSVLRRRRDLPPSAVRALDSFGTTDFALPDATPAMRTEAMRTEAMAESLVTPPPADPVSVPDPVPSPATRPSAGFEIADLVHRIEEYQRDRETPRSVGRDNADAAVVSFRFETDVAGVIRWIDSGPRGAVVGTSLADAARAAAPGVDGFAAGAFRKRASFDDARLVVGGASALGGDWRISGVPMFDPQTGRFTGFRGWARRPRVEEDAVQVRRQRDPAASEGLRRLVHELRTPTNAIAGFSELIEREMLGPVPEPYRDQAGEIRQQVAGLVTAIDDLDLAARIEGNVLDLRPGPVAIVPVLARVAEDLGPLATLRGSRLALPDRDRDAAWLVDSHGAERLLSRLLATLMSATGRGETIGVAIGPVDGAGHLPLSIDRPVAFAAHPGVALLSVDDEAVAGELGGQGGSLLGLGFALRLVRNFAVELGGRLSFGEDRLTLTLPAALNSGMEPASTIAP